MTLPDVERAIFGKLSADSGVTAIVGSGNNARIYEIHAPAGADLPYIVFYNASGIHPPQTPRDTLNYVFRIEAVVDEDSGAGGVSAYNLQSAIHSALSGASLSITGWSAYWVDFERYTTLIDALEQGRQIRRLIGDYRIRASKD